MAFRTKQQGALTPREQLDRDYKTARVNLLLVVILTAVSVVSTIFSEDGTYFVFSAAIPRYLVFMGCLLCGIYPNVDYGEVMDFEPFHEVVLIVMVVIATVIILAYFLCWLFSSKGRKVALIIALILFAIDTISLPILFDLSSILIDLVLHVVVIYYLVKGISAINKLEKMGAEEVYPEEISEQNQNPENEQNM